jgi:hypothetical protein
VRSCAAAPPHPRRFAAALAPSLTDVGLPSTACAANGPGLTRKAVRSARYEVEKTG